MSLGLTIFAGPHVHETRIGPLHADRHLTPSVVESITRELERQNISRNTVRSATPIAGESGRWHFELIEELINQKGD